MQNHHHDEVHNFVRKLLSLHGAGRRARLNIDCHGGQLWVSLHAELGEQPGQAVPLLPQHGAVPATRQTKPTPRRRRRKGGRPCREARRARRVLATFPHLPFYLDEADETPLVNPTHAPALHSAETVEAHSNSAEVVDMDILPPQPFFTPATSSLVSDDEEAAARRHACKERDARQSLALIDTDSPPDMAAMPAEKMLGCESQDSRGDDIDIDVFSPVSREGSNSLLNASMEEGADARNGRKVEKKRLNLREVMSYIEIKWREMAPGMEVSQTLLEAKARRWVWEMDLKEGDWIPGDWILGPTGYQETCGLVRGGSLMAEMPWLKSH